MPGRVPMTTTRDLFARRNLRCTTQRLAVYEALRACPSHPTAEELYRMVKPHTPRLSLATVYNTLEALCRSGLAQRLPTTNGSCRFDADTSEHLHVRARNGSEILDIPEELSRRLLRNFPREVLEEIEERLGIEIDGISIPWPGGNGHAPRASVGEGA